MLTDGYGRLRITLRRMSPERAHKHSSIRQRILVPFLWVERAE